MEIAAVSAISVLGTELILFFIGFFEDFFTSPLERGEKYLSAIADRYIYLSRACLVSIRFILGKK
jgi:hypothetical protein